MAGATLVALADESERSTGRPMTNGSSMGFRETSSAASTSPPPAAASSSRTTPRSGGPARSTGRARPHRSRPISFGTRTRRWARSRSGRSDTPICRRGCRIGAPSSRPARSNSSTGAAPAAITGWPIQLAADGIDAGTDPRDDVSHCRPPRGCPAWLRARGGGTVQTRCAKRSCRPPPSGVRR